MRKKFLRGEFIFACIINYLELFFIWAMFLEDFIFALIAALLTLIILYALVMTPLTDIYYRYRLGLRDPNEREAKRIASAWELVVRGTEKQGIKIPPDLKIFVKDAGDLNACATGRNTVAIYTPMLASIIKDEEIAGVIGHELGHIINGDTMCLLMAIQGSIVFGIIRTFYKVVAWIIKKLFASLFTFLGTIWSEGNLDAGIILGRIIDYIFSIPCKAVDLVFWLFIRVETAGYMFFSRQDEFAADEFSAIIGTGKGLRDNLARDAARENINKFSLEYILQGTHPPTKERIERIEIVLRRTEEDRKNEEQNKIINADKVVQLNSKVVETVDEDGRFYPAEEQFDMAMQHIKDGDEEQAVLLLKKAADGGYAKAFTELGKCYLYGIGVNPSKSEAVRYLKKSLETGDAEGIYLLAECYGSVGKESQYAAVAFRCYYKAASLGNVEAMAKAGLYCLEGRGIEKNEKAACNLLKIAVEKHNYQKAAYHLGKCYIQGIGTPIDIEKGVSVLRKGIECGCDNIDQARQLLIDSSLNKSQDKDVL